VFRVLSPGSPNVSIGVTENLILNERSKIIGITPDLLDGKKWNVVIRTKYMSSGLLKETREIMSSFTVQKAPASRDQPADQQTTPPLPSGDPSADQQTTPPLPSGDPSASQQTTPPLPSGDPSAS
jgi:hypothetical protein